MGKATGTCENCRMCVDPGISADPSFGKMRQMASEFTFGLSDLMHKKCAVCKHERSIHAETGATT